MGKGATQKGWHQSADALWQLIDLPIKAQDNVERPPRGGLSFRLRKCLLLAQSGTI